MLEQQLCQQQTVQYKHQRKQQKFKQGEHLALIITVIITFNNGRESEKKTEIFNNYKGKVVMQKATASARTRRIHSCHARIAAEHNVAARFLVTNSSTAQHLHNVAAAFDITASYMVKVTQRLNANCVINENAQKIQKEKNILTQNLNETKNVYDKSLSLNANKKCKENAYEHNCECLGNSTKRHSVKNGPIIFNFEYKQLFKQHKNSDSSNTVDKQQEIIRQSEKTDKVKATYKAIDFNSRRHRGRLRIGRKTPNVSINNTHTLFETSKQTSIPTSIINPNPASAKPVSMLIAPIFSTKLNVNAYEKLANATLCPLQRNCDAVVKLIIPKAITNVADCLFIKCMLLLYSIKNLLLLKYLLLVFIFIFCIVAPFKQSNNTFVYKYFQNLIITLTTTLTYVKTNAAIAANITIVITTLLLKQITRRNMKQIAKLSPKADENFYSLSAMMNFENFATLAINAIINKAAIPPFQAAHVTSSIKQHDVRSRCRPNMSKQWLLTIAFILLTTSQLCCVTAFKPKQQKPSPQNEKNDETQPPYQLLPPAPTWYEESGELLFHQGAADSKEHPLKDKKLPNYNDFDDSDVNTDENSFENKDIHQVKHNNATHYDNATKTPLFPKDLFTKEQLENGAVACHIIGVIYMFVALAIVCDEFFVPSLDVIIEKLGITDDVAGATFMAAGGSAPELFTSVIGVFVSFDDVGIGTIVGSAVFNILFVIGMCALFSRTVLSLTWWPLFRDCSFYSISLIVLIYFFRDNRIYWWEALILFLIYCGYVTFMKWNKQVESCVKKMITKNKVTRVRSTDQLMPTGNAANSSETSMATQPGGSVTSRAASESRSVPQVANSAAGGAASNSSGAAGTQHTGAKFRHGLLQLMIHTIDPLHDDDVPGKVDEKATQLHAIASLKVLLDATKPQRGGATITAANHVKINLKETTLADRPNGNIDTTLESPSFSGRRPSWIDQRVKIQTRKFSIKQTNEIEDEPEPLSMAWPDTARKRLTYILVAPLLIPMWLTLPDTRTPRGKRFFPVTFIGSILWIAAFSYLMVWWANIAGDTARIPPEVMGLTFLAAGTSIPDLITSVIVARKGFGDMAVSSSVGSNIFDVTVGLPIPWLLYGIIYDAPVEVNSVGMVCSITILFMMLLFVVMSIACFRWRMNKGLGFTMFLLYFVFVAVSLMFEYDVITCPV